MNPSKRGLGTAGQGGSGGRPDNPGLGGDLPDPEVLGASQSQGASSNPGPEQITGMPSLFYDFTKMQVAVDVNDPADSGTSRTNRTRTPSWGRAR